MLRRRKLALLFQFMGDASESTLLDVGGATGISLEFVPLYRAFRDVAVVNLTAPPLSEVSLPNVRYDIADGCSLPYPAKSFDWVFSNAVIEHVGGQHRQQQFADEIRRVARKGYFVTTPNRSFPIEPHALLPFYQFLPESLQRKVVRFSPGYLKHYEEIHLLSARRLRQLFPDAIIRSTGFPLVGTSLVAMYKDSSLAV
jgi:hypothetical protein